MVNRLVIVTDSFPYGPGEQFLELEMSYLVDHFREIVIVPMQREGKLRTIDSRIRIVHPQEIKHFTLYSVFNALISFTFWKELSKAMLNTGRGVRIRSDIYMYGYAINIYRAIIKANLAQADTIFYSYWLKSGSVALAMIKQNNKSIPVIARGHRVDIYEEENKNDYLPYRSLILHQLDHIFPIADHGKQYLIDRYGVSGNNISVSKLGVKKQGVMTQNSVEPDTLSILTCSFLVPVKRLGLLMQALIEFGKTHSNYRINWCHIGNGPEEEKLKMMQQELPDSIKMKFLGYMSHAEIESYYTNAVVDLLVNVSSSEGIPVSMMEAQSFSVPVMGTDVGGVSEIINEENGYLLSANPSVGEIVSRLDYIFNNKGELEQKKAASRTMWKTTYNADINYGNFVKQIIDIGAG